MPWSNKETRKTKTQTRVLLAVSLLLGIVGLGLKTSGSGSGSTLAFQTPTPTVPVHSKSPSPSLSAPAQPWHPFSENQISGPPFFVMIDPGHGGDDQGATFDGRLLEKDITLALGRRLKSELHVRGISARLVRDSDVTLSLDQRAENTNAQHAAVYIALHAGLPGPGVRVYAPAMTSSTPSTASKFLPWDSAQLNALPRSKELAQKIADELGKRNLDATSLATPLRPLNNIVAPAVAVELAPSSSNVQEMMSAKFQITVAAGVAAAIAQLRPQLERQP